MRHPLILPLYLPALLLSVAQGMLTPVLPLFAADFQVAYLWVGLALAGEGLGMLLGDLPNGFLLRRLEQKKAMMIGLGIIALSCLALFWARDILQVFALRLVAGYGSSLYNVARHTYIAETITIATRGRSVALLGGTFRAGRFVGPLIGGAVAAGWGLRAPFLLYGLVVLLSIGAIALFNHSAGGAEHFTPRGEAMTLASIGRTFREQIARLTFPGLGQALMQMVRAGPGVVIPLYGANVLGLDVQQIGLVLGIASMVDMTLFYPTGMIMDRWGRKFAIVPSALIMALGLAVIPLANSVSGLILAAALNGLGNGLGSGVMLTLGADLAPKHARGEFLGIWSLIGDAGSTGGPLLVGGVADWLALGPAAWAIAATGVVAAAVFGLLVPETLQKSSHLSANREQPLKTDG